MEKYKRYSEEQSYALIRKWESSGLTQDEFTKQHNIARSTFGYWRKKYLKKCGSGKATNNFIPVKINKTGKRNESMGDLELIYPNGVRLVCLASIELSKIKALIDL